MVPGVERTMSRIGKKPVEVPKGVNVSIADRTITIEGPLGKLSMQHRAEVDVTFDSDARKVVTTIDDARAKERQIKAYWGLTRSLIQNMVTGVTAGYSEVMEVQGVGYTATVEGARLKLIVGFANPVMMDIPAGLDVTVDRHRVTIKGTDKQMVGQFAADMRSRRKPEPYKGKGIKYASETIRRKQGKQFGS